MLLVEDSSVLLQARCHCTIGVGVWKMWSGNIYQVYLLFMILKLYYSVRSCVLYM